MSLFNTNPRLSHTRYKAASRPFLGSSWFTAVVDFINTRFTSETAMNVDTITEATTDEGVTIENVLLKDGVITSKSTILEGFPLWNGIDPSDWVLFIDDFINMPLDTGEITHWTITRGGGTAGTAVTAYDGLGGLLQIVSDGDNNDDCYVTSRTEAFLFDTDKKFAFKARIIPKEADTNKCNWVVGVSDTVAADFMQDGGAGPAATYDGAVFFKVDGDLNVGFETSNAGDQVTKADLSTMTADTAINLAFIYDYNDGTTAYITPYVNGVAGGAHAITIAGLQEMHLIMGVKSGSDAEETLLVDYVAIAQERR